jgi:6-phosphofructokinase 1
MNVTPKAVEYLRPLIQGESFPVFKNGIPEIKELKLIKVKKKLKPWA